MLTPDDLARYLRENGIDAEPVRLAEETPTVPAAAAAVGAETDQIGKSLLFLVEGEPLLVIANGEARVQYRRLASHLGVSRRRVRLANADEVMEWLGYPIGTVPPFGHRQPVRTMLEKRALEQTTLYVGGGGIDTLLRIQVAELRRVVGDEVVDLS